MLFQGSSNPSQGDEPKREENDELTESSPLLKIGTLIVIAGMAANVFGFRYSRWAVGKEIHRGWETHARNVARQAARERAKARKKADYTAYTRAQAEQARAREQAQAEERSREYTRREQAGRQARDNTRRAYKRWEETFTKDGYQRRVKVEFDTRFEEMFKGPFGIPEEVLKEFLRAAQMGQPRGRTEDFDASRFWEQVQGAQWRQGGAGSQSGTGGMGSGVFTGNRARHYAVLGLNENATPGEVKAAYRKGVMKWHPDKYRGPDKAGAERKFREVTDAYEALK